jgi:hypothetical protein
LKLLKTLSNGSLNWLGLALLVSLLAASATWAGETEPALEDSVLAAPSPVSWLEKVKLSGILNAEARWREHASASGWDSSATSDLYVRQFSLGIEAHLLQGASATVVLNSEWMGDELNQGDGTVTLDEIHFDLEGPVSFVVGQQTQPFGQFESDLVTDPMTQDAYETKQVGVTLGVNSWREVGLSFTAYKGTTQMDQLFESGLFDATSVRREGMSPRQVDSYILSAEGSPWDDHLTFFGAWLSEPGHGRRNTTGDAGLNFNPPDLGGLTADLEYCRALSRESYMSEERQYREGVLSVSLSYAFRLRTREVAGRRNYQGRRSSRSAHPVVATARYEYFDDDGLAAASGSWSLKDRVSVGARYAFRNDGSVLGLAQVEWRRSSRRGTGTGGDIDNEVYLRVGMDF